LSWQEGQVLYPAENGKNDWTKDISLLPLKLDENQALVQDKEDVLEH
jgi:hypothetical protein